MIKNFFLFLCGFFLLLVLAAAGLFQWFVISFPGDEIRQENIEQSLARESPVFYADGVTKVGVFFQDTHRQYLHYEELPASFVKAIVAAEDHQFFEHHGVDFPGFARAMLVNLRAGRVLQGGSTITQQTAKNLFERKGRSIKAKLKELLFALRLESHYPKEKILEFYANQFYVSGNGRGLGVAALYYFDKEPQELDLLESAFIAGSVKRPNYYNPFIKKGEESVAAARRNAKVRTGYVLGQMKKLGMIGDEEYQREMARDIPFKKGKMRFRLNTLMDLVREGLDDPDVEEALAEYGIENVATSGVRIHTTIDKKAQDAALSAVQKELSRLDVRLQGYDGKALGKIYEEMTFGAGSNPAPGQFFVVRVVEVRPGASPVVEVSFSPGEQDPARRGVIDQAGLMPLLTALVRYKGTPWSAASPRDLPQLLGQIKQGDLLYVSLREIDPDNGLYRFDLEKYPELQGAAVVLRQGRLEALVGGMDNYFYNRAMAGKRPMGSVVKPLLYAAAIQLGWNALDPLNNARNLFVYHRQAYIPRPDHDSPHDWVSMSWAGVHSENVASVWLLYHLCDKLTPGQFKELLAQVGMAREEHETYQQYMRRIRDSMGILVERSALEQAAFEQAVAASEADLVFDGRQEDVNNLAMLHYSDQFEEALDDLTDDVSAKEAEVRVAIVNRNFSRYQQLRQRLRSELQAGFAGESPLIPGLYTRAAMSGGLTRAQRFCFTDGNPGGGWKAVMRTEFNSLLAQLSPQEQEDLVADIRIDNQLSVAAVDLLADNTTKALRRLSTLPPYGEEVLHAIRDFRILAGLRYLIGLSREMGVESSLEPVLSFPLGSNVISLFELARVYQALTSGCSFRVGNDDNPGLALIDRIESADGDIIYQTEVSRRRLLDEKTTLAVSDILRKVVLFGTGRSARDAALLRSENKEVDAQLQQLQLRIPLFGKTGTANRFTNSAFAGALPGVRQQGDGLALADSGFTLAAYVGFDDNRPMTRGATRIAGSSGALPIWSRLAADLVLAKDFAGQLDVVDLAFSAMGEVPLVLPELGQIEVPVSEESGGLPMSQATGGHGSVVTFGALGPGGGVELERAFRPWWSNGNAEK